MDEDFRPDRVGLRPSRHQRGELRDSMFLQATMRLGDDLPAIPVRVRNISAGGLMAECTQPLAIGQEIDVELRNIGWVTGEVAWVEGSRMGVTFAQRIDPVLVRKPVGTHSADAMLVKRPAQRTRRPGLRIE